MAKHYATGPDITEGEVRLEAVRAERERCAKIAERVGSEFWETYKGGEILIVELIAAAIRQPST
jgi:hypothetical protein